MNNITKRNSLIVTVSCLIILFIFSGCDSKREYNDDIHIQLVEHQTEIIRRWLLSIQRRTILRCG